jgi:predicted DNA binding CopG/RHH family protein
LLSRRRSGDPHHLGAKGNTTRNANLREVKTMRAEYDFSKAVKNPYAAQLKKQITIRLDEESLSYFKSISADVGIPYQSLINLYLRDCATSNRKLNLEWK